MVCGSGPDEKRNQLFFSDFQCISYSLKPPRVQITRHCPGLHIKLNTDNVQEGLV